jgi:hypothetical protein
MDPSLSDGNCRDCEKTKGLKPEPLTIACLTRSRNTANWDAPDPMDAQLELSRQSVSSHECPATTPGA